MKRSPFNPYTQHALHSRVSIFSQDALVGIKSLDKLLRGQHGERVLQQKEIIPNIRNGFYMKTERGMNSQSDQNMERSRQVIHWEIRKAQTGRFLGAQGRSEGQELGNPEEQSTAPNERLK